MTATIPSTTAELAEDAPARRPRVDRPGAAGSAAPSREADGQEEAVPWLSDTEQRAWRVVHRMRGPMLAKIGRALTRDSGLSLPDYEVLVALSESDEGVVHVQDLLRSTDWEASRMSHHLSRMQTRGLVLRRPCPSDGRSSEVVLTRAGRTAIEQAAPRHVRAVRAEFIDLLSDEQLRVLGEIDQVIVEHLGDAAQLSGDCGTAEPGPDAR
ncbi:MarR family winged helix-turn-helix transcriptional regulator [Nakamurella aerolata]